MRGARRRHHRLPARGRRRHLGPQRRCRVRRTCSSASRSSARARGVPAHVGLDHAVRDLRVPRLRVRRALAARLVAAPRLRHLEHVGLPVPDARGHLRHRGRRVVVAHHPVHDLRRVPAAIGRRQVLPRLELRRDGQQPTGAGRTVVLASFLLGRTFGLGRRDDGDHRLGRVSHARARGLRQGRGGRAARRGRPGRHHLAAGARRRRVPHRRIPEDQLSRRAADGDDPHAPLLPVAVPDGGARRAQVRHARGDAADGAHASRELTRRYWYHFVLARLHRRVHGAGLLADPVRVLRDDRDLPRLVHPPRHDDGPEEARARAARRVGSDAQRGRHLRGRGHHRRRRRQDRPRPQVQRHRHRLRGRQRRG